MIRAIILDCFGVLATEGWLPFKAKYFGDKPELFAQVTDLSRQADRGLIDRQSAIEQTAKLADITPQQLLQAISGNVPDEALFDYLRQLKPDYKLGILSNISDDYLHQIFTKEQLALFDQISLSFEHGYVKPQMEAYDLAAEQLGVAPSECVMIDDQQRNVTGAREAGMQSILYSDVEQLRRELDPLLLKN
jgi:HAD superfamily hydrolase (TIGR01509 family)